MNQRGSKIGIRMNFKPMENVEFSKPKKELLVQSNVNLKIIVIHWLIPHPSSWCVVLSKTWKISSDNEDFTDFTNCTYKLKHPHSHVQTCADPFATSWSVLENPSIISRVNQTPLICAPTHNQSLFTLYLILSPLLPFDVYTSLQQRT